VTSLPYSMLAFARALKSKEVKMSNGTIAYSAAMTPEVDANIGFNIGYNSYSNQFNLGFTDPNVPQVNGFPGQTITGFAYTPEIGAAAFQKMCQVISTDSEGPNRSVTTAARTSLDYDVSAFSLSSFRQGLGAGGADTGGWVQSIGLEVPIARPFLGAANSVPTNVIPTNRFGVKQDQCVGDGFFIGSAMSGWLPENHWKMGRYPKLHAVDFLEFGDVLARWVSQIQQAWCQEPTNLTTVTGAPVMPIQCPLTLQEMLLVLRNVLMQAFKDTQYGVQGISPQTPSATADNQFSPYVASASTCFLQPTDFRMPMPLIENIRALVARFVHRGGPGSTDFEWFVPVLGQYQLDLLNESDYVFLSGPSDDLTVNLSFFPAADVYLKDVVDSKGKVTRKVFAEDVIKLIDGNSSSGLVAINNPQKLKNLSMKWSKWLADTGLDNFSVPLGTLGTEQGINVLASINMTRHWIVTDSGRVKKAKTTVTDVRNETLRLGYAHVQATPYQTREAVAVSSQSVLLATPYEEIQGIWILPVIKQQVTDQGSTLNPRWQAVSGETYESNSSSGFDGIVMSDLHNAYATKMVKGKQGAPSDWTTFFEEMAKQGRGGILSGLVSSFANMVIPGSGALISGIGDAIGV